MKLTIKQKMIGMGVGVVLAVGALWGVSEYATAKTNSANVVMGKAKELNELRLRQLTLINRYEYSLVQLTLVAMDSIIDKSEGEVSAERLAEIDKRSLYIMDNISHLENAVDTDKGRKYVEEVKKNAPSFIKTIKQDLVKNIKKSGKRVKEIEKEFADIDDELDVKGDSLGEMLELINHALIGQRDALGKAAEASLVAAEMKQHQLQTN